MTHEDLSANTLLESLPESARAKIRTLATQRRVPLTTLIKEALLKIADDINANNPSTRPAPYSNANAA